MHRFYFQRLGLCDEQGEAPVTTSGGTEETKLTIGAQIRAAIAAKADLQAKIGTLETQASTDKATITDLTSKLEAANAKITTLEADAAEVKSALDAHKAEVGTLKAEQKTVEQKAKEQVRALGFPAAELPAASEKITASSTEEQVTEINKKIESTRDPVEKGKLAQQAWDLMSNRNPAGLN
jgi:chromosome segregation ATPase